MCDGRFHCTDGSDESNEVCSKWNCTKQYWKCGSNECIHTALVCDGSFHASRYNDGCKDGSDESDEVCSMWRCPEGYWKCGSNECIPKDNVCDGNYNTRQLSCRDESDESDNVCATWPCPEGYWKCGSNECLLLVFVIITKCTLLSVLMDQMSLNISVQHGSALKGIGNVALVNVFMQRMFVTNNLAAQMHQMNQMKCVLSGSAREVTGDVTPMNV